MICPAACSMSATSLSVSFTATAPIFSSRRCSLVVPGMGTIQGLRANSQARAIWPGVALFRFGMPWSRSTSASSAANIAASSARLPCAISRRCETAVLQRSAPPRCVVQSASLWSGRQPGCNPPGRIVAFPRIENCRCHKAAKLLTIAEWLWAGLRGHHRCAEANPKSPQIDITLKSDRVHAWIIAVCQSDNGPCPARRCANTIL